MSSYVSSTIKGETMFAAIWRSTILFVFITLYFFSTYAMANGTASPVGTLHGTWSWVSTVTPVEKILPLPDETYTVEFMADGTLVMSLESNMVNGRYEADEHTLKIIPPLMMTMAAWRPGSPAPGFITLMENAAGYFFKDDRLYIDTFADGGTLSFIKVE